MTNTMQTHCDICGKGCPLSSPQCGAGAELAAELQSEGLAIQQPTDSKSSDAPSRKSHDAHRNHHGRRGGANHSHGHPNRESHSGERPHGHGRHGRPFPDSGGSGLPEDERLSRVIHHCARVLVHREKHQGGRSSVLAVLASHGEMSQARLAEKLDIRAASASELLSKMEADGFVERIPDDEDGRAYKVHLTPIGVEAAQEVMKERKATDVQLFKALTPDEKEQLTALLDKLATSWRHQR